MRSGSKLCRFPTWADERTPLSPMRGPPPHPQFPSPTAPYRPRPIIITYPTHWHSPPLARLPPPPHVFITTTSKHPSGPAHLKILQARDLQPLQGATALALLPLTPSLLPVYFATPATATPSPAHAPGSWILDLGSWIRGRSVRRPGRNAHAPAPAAPTAATAQALPTGHGGSCRYCRYCRGRSPGRGALGDDDVTSPPATAAPATAAWPPPAPPLASR